MTKDLEEALERIHKGDLLVLKEIRRICKKYGIRWFLDSGTLLGAVRHKEAIPWDDDADIAMFRSDYEKFRKVVRQELGAQFQFMEPADLKEAVFDYVPRIFLKGSSIREMTEEECFYADGAETLLAVDIFLIEDMADSDLYHRFCKGLLTICYGLGLGHRYALDYSKYKGAGRWVVRILAGIGKHISAGKILEMYDHVSRMESGKNKKKNRCYYANTLFGEIGRVYRRDWFLPETELQFSREAFPCPGNYDRVLTELYGNYMELPPEEKRTQPHMKPEYVKIPLL